ncbi:MAG: lipopolysaccharide biosynthesis protein [Rhodanobacter sp.]|nr:MAG: lipopolysaccharide biosynthesis protein [Rhodanobacter sp.]
MSKAKRSLRGALVLSFAQKYTSLVFNLLTVIIVSRLLTPEQIGVFSVAVGLTALAQMLRTFGVSEYLVQEKTLHEGMIRTSFTINLILAWLLAAGLFAASWLIGGFYGDPGVGQVVRVLSATFILTPFGTTAMALLQRNMEFGLLYKIRTGEVVVRSSVTIGLAFAGFGYMSMAWASLAAMVAWIAGCTIWGHEYRARGLSLSEWRLVVPFGVNRTVSDVVSELGQQSANLVVGKMLGLVNAGFYSRGYSVVNIFREKVISAIGAVAFPAFALEHRERNAAPELYLRSLVYLTGISWPFFAFSAFMAFPIIRILFGNQWDAAVPLMRWLCGAAIVGTLIYQCNQLFIALGRVGAVTTIEIQYQIARLVIAIVAALYSVEAVAASQVLVYGIATVLYYRKMLAYDGVTMSKMLVALLPSAGVTVTSCIVPAAVAFWPGLISDHLITAFAVSVLGSGIGWLLGVIQMKHPILDELRHALSFFRNRLRTSQS